jgi:Asp-tRNA(Asn)/Glu-tRNA(Gln) amidotransferase A subunit family amidase
MHYELRKVTAKGSTDRQTLAPLASAVRTGVLTAAELVEESLARIDAATELGAVVRTCPVEARAAARRIDGRVKAGEDPGPLAGLPALVKDNEAVAGLPTTFGSMLRASVAPETGDGLVAGVLRGAGAVIVGKTNLPEFAFEGYTDNRLFGPTTNPWDRSLSPGGSSGGSGAAIAAGLAAIATATDVGGSIRIPAALCGLVGLKPTSGLIALDAALVAPACNSHGPLTTSVADAGLLLDVLVAGSPGPDAPMASHPDDRRRPRRVIVSDRIVAGPPLPEDLASAFREGVDSIAAAIDATVEETDPDRIFPNGYDPEDWFRIVGFEQWRALDPAALEADASLLDPTFRRAMRLASALDQVERDLAGARCRRYAADLDRLLAEDAVLLTPTLTVPGWTPDGRLDGTAEVGLPGWVYNTEPANLTGHPALSIPGGLLSGGRPFGIQVIGPRSSDRLLLEVAAAFERVVAWPLAAPGRRAFTLDSVGSARPVTT